MMVELGDFIYDTVSRKQYRVIELDIDMVVGDLIDAKPSDTTTKKAFLLEDKDIEWEIKD